MPLELVQDWLHEGSQQHYRQVQLTQASGLVQVDGLDYDDIEGAHLSPRPAGASDG
ncbi:MAG: hypothetical protein H6740_29580 [Alphaproteobacteria bacterium]|nr:hypothetical protein [Alphaproteobacteria bacterium]